MPHADARRYRQTESRLAARYREPYEYRSACKALSCVHLRSVQACSLLDQDLHTSAYEGRLPVCLTPKYRQYRQTKRRLTKGHRRLQSIILCAPAQRAVAPLAGSRPSAAAARWPSASARAPCVRRHTRPAPHNARISLRGYSDFWVSLRLWAGLHPEVG